MCSWSLYLVSWSAFKPRFQLWQVPSVSELPSSPGVVPKKKKNVHNFPHFQAFYVELLIFASQFQIFYLHSFNHHVQVLLGKLQYIYYGTNRQTARGHMGEESITGMSRAPKKSNATSLALGELPREALVSWMLFVSWDHRNQFIRAFFQ